MTQRVSADESRPAGARMRIITSSGFRSGVEGCFNARIVYPLSSRFCRD